MDHLIRRFDAERDGDLMLVPHRGLAYQRDMKAARISYDDEYLKRYESYEGKPCTVALNQGRTAMLGRHLERGKSVLDIGAASGAFVRAACKAGYMARGYDVIKTAMLKLVKDGLWANDPNGFHAVTYWDSLEHIEDPNINLRAGKKGSVAIVAMPIFERLDRIRESKHYKPGEHLYYFTRDGFVNWMALYGYRLLEESDHEMAAGRESIGSFAFMRDLPDYRDHIGAYLEMHASRHYGSSSVELHLDSVATVVRELKPNSIIDYGCGRSDLVAHFWKDGQREIHRYDPAIPMYKGLPARKFDMALCTDVMEHIPMDSVDRVFGELKQVSDRVLFTISTKPARAKLPDGRNAHVTLLRNSEWTRWVDQVFGGVQVLPTESETELILLAGKG